jgi:nitronate monooxygenase
MTSHALPSPVLSTRFTSTFGVTHPIMLAPMGGATDAGLVVAVSSAGGLGSFGAMHPRQPDAWVAQQITEIRASIDGPFAVGFNTVFLPLMEARFNVALEAEVPVVMLSFGDPKPWIDRAHAAGARVICQVQTPSHARAAVDAGADALVVQGNEAGGHTGAIGLLPLLDTVLDWGVDLPVLAAGGIASGRTLAAVLTMGADGACIGTALLASQEASPVHPSTKDLITASDGSDTVWTSSFDIALGWRFPDGIRVRAHANDFTREWEGREDELRSRRAEIGVTLDETDADQALIMYGQSAAAVTAVRPVAEIIHDLVERAAVHLRSHL